MRAATGVGSSFLSLDFRYAERLAETYAEVAKSRPLLETVITTLDLNLTTEELARSIDVRVIPNTELIEITAEHRDPKQAAAIANSLGEALVEYAGQLYAAGGRSASAVLTERLEETEAELAQLRVERDLLTLDPEVTESEIDSYDRSLELKDQTRAFLMVQIQNAWMTEALRSNAISFVEQAVPPSQPTSPRLFLNGAVGLLAGLLGGAGLAFTLDKISPIIQSRKDLEVMTDLPVLAEIPHATEVRRRRKRGLELDTEALQRANGPYSLLGAKLQALCGEYSLTSFLVTSAESGQGKSTVTANLGIELAKAGLRVVLVESDFRRPNLHDFFNLEQPTAGLSEVIQSNGMNPLPLHSAPVDGLRILASGDQQAKHVAVLNSPVFRTLVDSLVRDADVVLFDGSPVLEAPDASLIASVLDGVLLVVSIGKTTRASLDAALDQLDQIRAWFCGIVLT
jgi:non-specific protein-tyrosine kinase